jgi:hypothetical protein
LEWRQIGILETLKSSSLPFFVQWDSEEHPSKTSQPVSEIIKIVIRENEKDRENVVRNLIDREFNQVEIERTKKQNQAEVTGIIEVHFSYRGKVVIID